MAGPVAGRWDTGIGAALDAAEAGIAEGIKEASGQGRARPAIQWTSPSRIIPPEKGDGGLGGAVSGVSDWRQNGPRPKRPGRPRRRGAAESKGTKVSRWESVDVGRGAAVAAMAVYHFAWDLEILGLASLGVEEAGGWIVARTAILSSFLALAGLSLSLRAHRGFRWPALARRIGVIALGAALISGATLWLVPDRPVLFGVLHCIALSLALAVPFLRAPGWLVLAAALAALALPGMWPVAARPELLADPALLWLGLSPMPPASVDYVPLLPWFGVVLLGLLAGRLVLAAEGYGALLAGWRSAGPAGRALAWTGRHALPVYLLHQPLLIGLLLAGLALTGGLQDGLARVHGPGVAEQAAAERAAFLESCAAGCRQGGGDAATCRQNCLCLAETLDGADLWRRLAGGEALTEAEAAAMVDAAAAVCRP